MLVRKKDPATVPRAAFEVLDSAQRAAGLINDLLDLSRLDEDRLKPVIRATEPVSIARRSAGAVMPAAFARHVTVSLEAAENLPSCETDASRVEQILVNLLGNAIHHTREGTRIFLRVHAHENSILYIVDDEGEGIPEGDLESIFDIYVTTAAGESRGVGLGLPLSRRLARLMGGELEAVSRPGVGGRFILRLPASVAT
jgi:two-component system secretion sensor histidine kinase SsrA